MKFKLGRYLKKYTWLSILGPFCKFLETVSDLVTPILIAKILDEGIPTNNKSMIIWLSVFVLGMNLLGFVFAIICQKCAALTSQGIAKDLRKDIYTKITTLSSNEMDKYTTMSMTNRTVHDVSQIKTAIGMTLRQVARAPFLLVGSTILAVIINPRLSLVFLVAIPIILMLFFLVLKKSSPLYLTAKKDLDNLSNVTRENLSGTRVVRAFNKQRYEMNRFDVVNQKYTQTNIRVGTYAAILQPLLALSVNFSIIAVIYFGGVQINVGGMTQGTLISFINYLAQISISLLKIARLILTYTRTGASIKRINEIFALQPAVENKENAVILDETIAPKIEFKNVCFSYNGIKNALKDFSLTIEPGETVGVIGGTGSGKSSLVNLIPRFYNVTKGKIEIGGRNINDYEINSLRNYVSIVMQNPTLLSGTIESNLKLRKSDATFDELKKALMISQSYEFVNEKPNGIKSVVERGGRNFSGGQRQRLTIARAIVGKPKILILDDSSSALDFETDYKLRKALASQLKDTTKIFVSQRTNSIAQADKIVVLDNGNVVGVGKHEELLENCKVYREIYRSQNR